jgi:NADPH:quinone reductase-like Zn-dependent oxidoreductase
MRRLALHTLGDASSLNLEELPTPPIGEGEALVRVHAAAITRDELDWPEDRLPATPSYEFSGVVSAIGPGVDQVEPGAAVYALSSFDRDGAAADYIVLPARYLAPKPTALDHVEAAAVPLAGLTAWQGLFDHGRLAAGERVLIHGAAGGVGGFAVQLARARGAHVMGSASGDNVQATLGLGAHEVVDHTSGRFEDELEPVDLVFDTAGGERLERSPALLQPGGRLVSIATEPPKIDPERQIDTAYFVVKPDRPQLIELAKLADSGELRPTIDRTYALADAKAAFGRLLEHGRRGKVVLTVAPNREP